VRGRHASGKHRGSTDASVSEVSRSHAQCTHPHREMNALSPTFSERCANFADTTTGFFGMTMVGSTSADLAGMTMPARGGGGCQREREWAQIRKKKAGETHIMRWCARVASRTGRRLRHDWRIRRQINGRHNTERDRCERARCPPSSVRTPAGVKRKQSVCF
jgi:hypothetical protein